MAPGFQACDAWQREAKEAKERALAADSARQLALQKKEEVEAQFRRLQEELEGRGLASALPGLSGCGDIGAIPLPKLHSLQSQLRLDLEAVDGVSTGSSSRNQRAEHRGGAGGLVQLPSAPPLPPLSHRAPLDRGHVTHVFGSPSRVLGYPPAVVLNPLPWAQQEDPSTPGILLELGASGGCPPLPVTHVTSLARPAHTSSPKGLYTGFGFSRRRLFRSWGPSCPGPSTGRLPSSPPLALWGRRPWEPSPTPEACGGSSRPLLAPGWPQEGSLPQPNGASRLARR